MPCQAPRSLQVHTLFSVPHTQLSCLFDAIWKLFTWLSFFSSLNAQLWESCAFIWRPSLCCVDFLQHPAIPQPLLQEATLIIYSRPPPNVVFLCSPHAGTQCVLCATVLPLPTKVLSKSGQCAWWVCLCQSPWQSEGEWRLAWVKGFRVIFFSLCWFFWIVMKTLSRNLRICKFNF